MRSLLSKMFTICLLCLIAVGVFDLFCIDFATSSDQAIYYAFVTTGTLGFIAVLLAHWLQKDN